MITRSVIVSALQIGLLLEAITLTVFGLTVWRGSGFEWFAISLWFHLPGMALLDAMHLKLASMGDLGWLLWFASILIFGWLQWSILSIGPLSIVRVLWRWYSTAKPPPNSFP